MPITNNLNSIAETLVHLDDIGIKNIYSHDTLSKIEQKFNLKERELDNAIDHIIIKRESPVVIRSIDSQFVKVIFKEKIYYYRSIEGFEYDRHFMNSEKSFDFALGIVDIQSGELLKNRVYLEANIYETYLDKQLSFS